MSLFRWNRGSVQSKVISLIILASTTLLPLQTVHASFSDGTPTVFNANVFSGQNEPQKTDQPTGAFIQTLPMDIPPGRNGLQPEVTLDYNSQRTEDSIVGYGWALSIPYIQRLSKTGSQDIYGANRFTSSIEGELVASSTQTTTTAYMARVDDGSFNSYTFTGNTWTVYDKKGTRYLYGSDDSGRMYDTSAGTSTKTYRWMLQEVRDTNGNYVKYAYNTDNNVVYPYKITYTGNGSTDGIFTVTFATSTRPDTRISYATGFSTTLAKRISEIDASINGSIVRKLLLGYGAGNNGYRSLLTSVQQQGYDDSGNLTSLPATTFVYASSTAQFYTTGGATSQSRVVADVQGNGLNDVSVFYQTTSGQVFRDIYIDHTGSSLIQQSAPDYWASQCSCTGEPYVPNERGVRYLDVNADGKADLLRGYWNYTTSTSTNELIMNTYSVAGGYGWTSTSTASVTIPAFSYDGSGSLHNVTTGIFGDVNGDGLPDYEQDLNGIYNSAFLGNGTAWDATTTVFSPMFTMPYSSSITPVPSQLIDINGDGLDDWVYSDGTHTYVLLNTGNGWSASPASQWTVGTSTLYSAGSNTFYDRGIRFFDINGDGLPDFVRSYTMPPTATFFAPAPEFGSFKFVMLNTRYGWATSTAYSPSYITTGILDTGAWKGQFLYDEDADWSGNGQLNQDVLTSVTSSKGAITTISYTPSAQFGTNPELPISLLVVSSISTNDGLGTFATTTYSYLGGKLYFASGIRDRKFAGFATTTVTAPDSINTTLYDQGDGVQTGPGEQADGYGQISHPFRKDIFDISNNLQQRTYYRWDTITHGNSTSVVLGQQLTEAFGSDGSHRDRATLYSYSSSTKNLIKQIDYGEVTGNSDGTFLDVTGDTRTTNIQYTASSSVNMSLPVEKTMLNSNSATSSDQKYYYDALSFGSVALGNSTKEEDWISGTTYASSTKAYNSYGLVATSTDADGHAASYVYDSYNLFPATTTNALLQKTQAYYNYSNGKVKQSTDPNSRLARSFFDGIGRVIGIAQSSTSSPSTYATTTVYAYTDSTTSPSTVHRSDYLSDSTSVDTYDYYDGFNRLIQERKQAQTSNIYGVFDRVFNGVNEIASTSLPYFSSGSSFTNPTTVAALGTDYTYDALQRVTRIANAVGNRTNAFYKWTMTTTDPNGHVRDSIIDPFGNLINVVEHGTGLATTTYAYDSLNNLATTTDALGNVRAFTYDGLSRRTSAQDLHAVGDATFGTWSYAYDPAGNLTSQTDPKSQVVNRTYDALNRMTSEDYTGQSGTEISNTYDSCTNGIGYMCVASSTSAKTGNSYDIVGRISVSTTTIQNASYPMSYAYDRQGNLTSLVYPDGSQVNYSYNLAGMPNRVQRKAAGGSFADIISNYDYAPQGQIQNAKFGNNASTTYFYDANAIYRLSNLQTTQNGATSIQRIAYTYDPAGNITQIANSASTSAYATTAYTYDALNRLLSTVASNGTSSPYGENYSYDALGNLLSRTNIL